MLHLYHKHCIEGVLANFERCGSKVLDLVLLSPSKRSHPDRVVDSRHESSDQHAWQGHMKGMCNTKSVTEEASSQGLDCVPHDYKSNKFPTPDT